MANTPAKRPVTPAQRRGERAAYAGFRSRGRRRDAPRHVALARRVDRRDLLTIPWWSASRVHLRVRPAVRAALQLADPRGRADGSRCRHRGDELDGQLPAVAPPAKKAGRPQEVVRDHNVLRLREQGQGQLERRIHSMNMQDRSSACSCRMEDEVEFKDGKRKITPKKSLPGYVGSSRWTWTTARGTSYATRRASPVLSGRRARVRKPVPLQDKEVKTILKQMGIETPKLKIRLRQGRPHQGHSGPFFDFTGSSTTSNPKKKKSARSSRSSAAKRRWGSSSTRSKRSRGGSRSRQDGRGERPAVIAGTNAPHFCAGRSPFRSSRASCRCARAKNLS